MLSLGGPKFKEKKVGDIVEEECQSFDLNHKNYQRALEKFFFGIIFAPRQWLGHPLIYNNVSQPFSVRGAPTTKIE